MAVSSVKRRAFGNDALNYVLSEKGHNNAERRNEIVTPINMRKGIPYNQQMNKYWLRASIKHKTQLITIIQSFSKKEFDPTNSYDIEKANQLGQELVDTHYPGRQALVCTQIDGKGGYVHNHILINDVSLIDGKGCEKEQYYHPYISKWTDEITEKYTIRDEGENEGDRLTRADLERRLKKEFLYKDKLRICILNAMDKSMSEQEFFARLKRDGVDVIKKSSKKYGEFYTYELVDLSCIPAGTKLPDHAMKSRSYKLGPKYGPKALQEHIDVCKRAAEGRFTANEYLAELNALMQRDSITEMSRAAETSETSVTTKVGTKRYEEAQASETELKNEITEEKIPQMSCSNSVDSDSATEEETVVIPAEAYVQTEPVPTAVNVIRQQSDDDSDEEKEKKKKVRRKEVKQAEKNTKAMDSFKSKKAWLGYIISSISGKGDVEEKDDKEME